MTNMIPVDVVSYFHNVLPKDEADYVYKTLREELDWLAVTEAREEYWTNTRGADYTYGSGIGVRTYASQPNHPLIGMVRKLIQNYWRAPNKDIARWEGCFLNYYANAKNALGWHADDAEMIDHSQPIAVLSLGAERPIMIRPVNDPDPKQIKTITLTHGSLFLMKPGMQQTHLHKIPRAPSECGGRISLTFRSLL